MRKRLYLSIITLLLVVFSLLSVSQRPQAYYPLVQVASADALSRVTISFLFSQHPTLESCEALTGKIAREVLARCTTCSVSQLKCLDVLSSEQKVVLADQPLDVPSGRMAKGVVTFHAVDAAIALATCKASETQLVNGSPAIRCFPANTPRISKPPETSQGFPGWQILAVVLAALIASSLTVWLILKYEHLHAHLSHDHVDSGPQKYHEEPTPRIGGVAVMTGLLMAIGVLGLEAVFSPPKLGFPATVLSFGLLLLSSTPAFLGGLVEDITKKVGVVERLLLTMLAGSIAAWLLGGILTDLGMAGLYTTLIDAFPLFAVVFTVFAVGGIANSINIIDGYNGLAAGFAIIVLMALAYVAYQVGDHFILIAALSLSGAAAGFLVWNWPAGKIFLGDGGAYLIGFLIAELSVLLVVRNPAVSPWFPLALLIYPVFETIYSIYRRKVLNKLSPGQPDNQHFHQLIHDHLIPRVSKSGREQRKLERNSRVAKYLWGPTIVIALLSSLFWSSQPELMFIVMGFCVFYVVNYKWINTALARQECERTAH